MHIDAAPACRGTVSITGKGGNRSVPEHASFVYSQCRQLPRRPIGFSRLTHLRAKLTPPGAVINGQDVHIGRRLPGLLRATELVDIDMDAKIRVFRPGQPYHQLLLRFVQIHRDRILARGVLNAAALTDSARRLQAHLEDPNTFTLYATLVQATGRKP